MRSRVDAAMAEDGTLIFSGVNMDRCVGTAALLVESDRRDLAIQALARSATISDLSARHGVSRKFIYQQTDKARTALDDAFMSAAPGDEVLFEVAVTKTWLRQVIVGLTLICRGSYRGRRGVPARPVGGVHQHRHRSSRAPGGHTAGRRRQPRSGPVGHSCGPA